MSKFFRDRFKAIKALYGKPCVWADCGQPSTHYISELGTNLKPLCDLHAERAKKNGFVVTEIEAPEYNPVFPHPDDMESE